MNFDIRRVIHVLFSYDITILNVLWIQNLLFEFSRLSRIPFYFVCVVGCACSSIYTDIDGEVLSFCWSSCCHTVSVCGICSWCAYLQIHPLITCYLLEMSSNVVTKTFYHTKYFFSHIQIIFCNNYHSV